MAAAKAAIGVTSAYRIENDRRDALSLARLARAGELTFVVGPDQRDEAIRDLSRARIDAVRARLKARQQLKALLLRHGRRYTGKISWTAAHERYLAAMSFAHRAQDIAFVEYRQAGSKAQARVERLNEALDFLCARIASPKMSPAGVVASREMLPAAGGVPCPSPSGISEPLRRQTGLPLCGQKADRKEIEMKSSVTS